MGERMSLPQGKPFKEGICAKCKGFMIFRPDYLPLCSECEKQMLEEVARRFPQFAKGKKLVLHSSARTK